MHVSASYLKPYHTKAYTLKLSQAHNHKHINTRTHKLTRAAASCTSATPPPTATRCSSLSAPRSAIGCQMHIKALWTSSPTCCSSTPTSAPVQLRLCSTRSWQRTTTHDSAQRVAPLVYYGAAWCVLAGWQSAGLAGCIALSPCGEPGWCPGVCGV